jgi:hypothetical protein
MSQGRNIETYQSFAENLGTNIVHPLGAAVFLVAALWTILAPRKYLAWPLIFIACFISPAQRFAFLTIDLDFLRAITILTVLRILVLGELRQTRIRAIDYCVFGMMFLMVLAVTARTGGSRTIHEIGQAVDSIGIYLIGRAAVRKWDDLKCLLLGAGIASIPVMIFFTIEQFTQWNFFSLLGGVPEQTTVRDGQLRAQGAFTHPIIAGMFWATFAAMFIGVIFGKRRKLSAILSGWIGTINAVVIAFMTNSSTPIAGLLVAVGCWMCFPYRMYLKTIRWVVLLFMVFIHLIHSKGVHSFIFTNISFVSGSTGRHRYLLIDGALSNITDWALYGSRRKYNRSFHDITCDYVYTAVTGGLIPLILEIAIIVLALYACGRAIRAVRNREELFLAYGVGASVLTVSIMAVAVSVYGQAELPFYLSFGIAASLGNLEWLPKKPAYGSQKPVRQVTA